MARKPKPEDLEPVMGRDPLADDDEILAETFYGRSVASEGAEVPAGTPAPAKTLPARRTSRRARSKKAAAPPSHYKIVSISLYNEDIEKIDQLVAELKDLGHTKANRSALIRYAIDTVDISKMPKGY